MRWLGRPALTISFPDLRLDGADTHLCPPMPRDWSEWAEPRSYLRIDVQWQDHVLSAMISDDWPAHSS